MTRLLFILAIFLPAFLFAQKGDSIPVKHIQKKYHLANTCYQTLAWDEVVLPNKAAETYVNSEIRTAVQQYKIDSTEKDMVNSWCNKQMESEHESKIVYSKNDLISYWQTSYTFSDGAAHGWREFLTMNFDAIAGRKIKFHDLIDSNKIALVDTFIIHKFKARPYKSFDDTWVEQLQNLEFTISEKGLNLIFRMNNGYSDEIFTFKELEPFVNTKGLLKRFYQ